MIYFNINRADDYLNMDPRLHQALDMLRRENLSNLEPGRYEAEMGMYYMCQSYETKPEPETCWETHMKYIDVQYMVAGREGMGVRTGVAGLKLRESNPEKDYALYDGDDGNTIVFGEGDVMVFYPGDPHRPCKQIDKAAEVRKIVFKIPAQINQ